MFKYFLQVLLIILFYNIVFAQNSIDSIMYSYANKYWNGDKIIFVQGRNCEKFNEALNKIYRSWREDTNYVVKYEDQLDSADLTKHLNFFGPIKSYNNLNLFLPRALSIANDGFKFGSYEFKDSMDAINLINSEGNRRFQLGNSLMGVQSIWTTFSDISQYMIMQNYAITNHGFLDNDKYNPAKNYNRDSLRNQYLLQYNTKYYTFYYDPETINKHQNKDSVFKSEDEKYLKILKIFNMNLPGRKIECYVYKDLEQKYYFSATPGYGNPFINAYQNHSVGFGPVEHESIHILFDNLIGGYSTFFSEGEVGYFYSTIDSTEWKRNRGIVSSSTEINIVDYLNNKGFDFSQLDYAAAAYFVKFLIDTHGLDNFKAFFKYKNIEEGFKEAYGMTTGQISEEWKRYFEKTKIKPGPDRKIIFEVIADDIPDSSVIYIAGDNAQLGGWDPGKVALEKNDNNEWIKSFVFPEGAIFYYKITRGSWDKEALDKNGNIPQNSVYEIKQDDTIRIVINKWKDQ